MSKGVIIQAADMIKFLEDRGFSRIQLDGTKELVFAKGFRYNLTNTDDNDQPIIVDSIPMSLRVYTSVAYTGRTRDLGLDAIRVCAVYRGSDGRIYTVGTAKKVLRVEGWRNNLADRLIPSNVMHILEPKCPTCAAPMVVRPAGNGSKFFGCIRYHSAGCKGTADYKEE